MDTDLTIPQLSVTMTVYNAAPFLAEAIDSVLNQTFTDFEFLILDDASTDTTKDIIFEKQAGDARIKYFKNEVNSGLAKTKNKIISLTKGALIAVVDGDDVNLPTRFEKQVALFNAHPDVHVVSSAMSLIDVKGKICDTWHYPVEDADIKKGFQYATMIAHPASMFRREVFLKLNGYDERLSISEDWDYFYRASNYFNLRNIAEPLVLYRIHDSNMSVNKLEYTVLYAIYFKYKLPMSCFEYNLRQLVEVYPQYKRDVCHNINRFYSFSMQMYLKLGYTALCRKLHEKVRSDFFIFFDRSDKKLFLKNAISVYIESRRFAEALPLLKDYIFLK